MGSHGFPGKEGGTYINEAAVVAAGYAAAVASGSETTGRTVGNGHPARTGRARFGPSSRVGEPMRSDREERIREERIRLRALQIWREQGCPEGRAREHWERAEREVGGDENSEAGGETSPTNPNRRGDSSGGPSAT